MDNNKYFFTDETKELVESLSADKKNKLVELMYVTIMGSLETYYANLGWFKVDIDSVLEGEHDKFVKWLERNGAKHLMSLNLDEPFRNTPTDDQFENDSQIDLGIILLQFGVK